MTFKPDTNAISAADDVSLSLPAAGQLLSYDAAIKKWVNQTVTKASVGLGAVDNTSDASKPVSADQASADSERLRWRGVFATGTSYAINDVITSSGSVYRAQIAHTAGLSGPTGNGDSTYWQHIGDLTVAAGGDTSLLASKSLVAALVIKNESTGVWPSRPTGYASVTWRGSDPSPTDMAAGDIREIPA